MKKKITNTIIIAIAIFIVMLSIIYVQQGSDRVKEKYYHSAFEETLKIYIESSGVLTMETQEELDVLKQKIKECEKRIDLLETNSQTIDGEKIIDNLLNYTYQAINLKQAKFDENEMWNNDGMYELSDQIRFEFKEFTRNFDESGIKLSFTDSRVLMKEMKECLAN